MKREDFQEKVLKEFPKLKPEDKFRFDCKPGIACFNKCCNDVNIFLTPYDIARLRKALGISSGEFLEKHTLLPIDENLKHPVVMLRMLDDGLDCPFVNADGCTVYDDRPWSCRMFPLGVASPGDTMKDTEGEFYFLLKEDVCEGFSQKKEWSVLEWMNDQNVKEYQELGELFKEISLHKFFRSGKPIEPVKLEMFYMACYDIDKFRDFVFKSTFLKRFEVESKRVDKMREDDAEMLRFAFEWIRFALFGEESVKIKKEIADSVKK